MKTRAALISISIAIAFFVGRVSVPRNSAPADSVSAVTASSCPPEKTVSDAPIEPRQTLASSDSKSVSTVGTPLADASSSAKLDARGTANCLERVARRDVAEWMAVLDARMEQFQKSDPQFASRNKMGAADWKRTQSSGDVKATITFKFESVISAQVEVQFKQGTITFSALHRSSKTAGDTQSHTGTQPLQNGYSIGLERDGSGYHVAFENPVKASGWVDYSHFAFAVPYDWDRRSEIPVDVFGLNEAMKWEKVGSANLVRPGN